MKRSIAVCLGLLALPLRRARFAGRVVEDVKGKVTGAELMEYGDAQSGHQEGEGGSVILSYLKSCRRLRRSRCRAPSSSATEESAVHSPRSRREGRMAIPARPIDQARDQRPVAATVLRRVDKHGSPAADRSSRL